MKTPGKLVLIEWQDSCSLNESWQDVETATQYHTSITCYSVGWVLRKDKQDIVIAATFDEAIKNVGEITAIPLSCVLRIKNLKMPA